MSRTIKILGIDPALRNTGLAIAEYNLETGKLNVTHVEIAQTEKNQIAGVRRNSDDLARGRILVREILRVVAVHKPTLAMAEIPAGCQSARGAFSNGVCCGILASVSTPVIEVTPNEVKLASTGSRTATKAQIINWAVENWPNVHWMRRKLKGELVLMNDNEHMADACAAIAAGILTPQFAQAIAMMQAMEPRFTLAA